MATIVEINPTNPQGNEILQACAQLRDAFARFEKIDGQRAQAIAVSATEFETRFGITTGGGQALSDRISALLAFIQTEFGGSGYEYTAKVRDVMDATFKKV